MLGIPHLDPYEILPACVPYQLVRRSDVWNPLRKQFVTTHSQVSSASGSMHRRPFCFHIAKVGGGCQCHVFSPKKLLSVHNVTAHCITNVAADNVPRSDAVRQVLRAQHFMEDTCCPPKTPPSNLRKASPQPGHQLKLVQPPVWVTVGAECEKYLHTVVLPISMK